MGAGPNSVLDKGFLLEGSAAVAQFECVVYGDKEQGVKRASAAGVIIAGVVQEEVTADRMSTSAGKVVVDVRMMGITTAIASAAIAKGDLLAVAADGKVVKATTGQFVVGVAQTAATAAGQFVEMLLTVGAKAA